MRHFVLARPSGRQPIKPAAILSAVALTASLFVLGGSVPAVAATTAARAGDPTLHGWIAGFQNRGARGSNAATTPEQDARNFDLIIDTTGQPDNKTAAVVDSLHVINPKLKYLVYLSGCCNVGQDTFNYPESSFAHNTAGHRLTSPSGGPLMNRRDATWRNHRASLCQQWVTQYHFDGCFFDSFSFTWFTSGSSVPIDPATNQPWTLENYDQVGQQILADVRATVRTVSGAPVLLGFNGLTKGNGYFAKNKGTTMLPNTDYAMAEIFLISPDDAVTAYRSEADWKADVDMVADVGRRGKHFIGTVKSWSTGTQAQKDQLLKYASASFLLGADPTATAYLNFQNEQALYGGSQYYAWWNRKLGKATGAYFKAGNCYVRTFGKGKVVVNPTTAACSYPLGGTYTDLGGSQVTTASLPSHTASIYTTS
jgi:putative glycosyl hydrolase-like family 15 (GHL15) protein